MKLLYKLENHHALDPNHKLQPGLNEVPQDVWDKSKDHPAVKSMIASKVLFEVADQPAPAVGVAAEAPSTAKAEEPAAEAPAAEDAEKDSKKKKSK